MDITVVGDVHCDSCTPITILMYACTQPWLLWHKLCM